MQGLRRRTGPPPVVIPHDSTSGHAPVLPGPCRGKPTVARHHHHCAKSVLPTWPRKVRLRKWTLRPVHEALNAICRDRGLRLLQLVVMLTESNFRRDRSYTSTHGLHLRRLDLSCLAIIAEARNSSLRTSMYTCDPYFDKST